MDFKNHIVEAFKEVVKECYDLEIDEEKVILNQTRKEFEGDYTIVVFPYVKQLKKSPQEIGDSLGSALVEKLDDVTGYNIIQGFLNLSFSNGFWMNILSDINQDTTFGSGVKTGEKVMVEFSSPNTNKPLHLGHIRNILLGWSASQILETAGNEVIKTQIINDRGIAICKSMLAWKKFGEGKSPEEAGVKGDHFVGGFYVLFEKKFQEEYKAWQVSEKGQAIAKENMKEEESEEAFFKRYKNTYFNDNSILGNEAKDMLIQWEAGDDKTRQLWMMMNEWVYDGFDVTYKNLGVNFDSLYFESDTYLLGKDAIEDGIESRVFYKKEDGSVWIDLEDAGMDHKLVLRSDGTSVYMTQDIGTAMKRYTDTGAGAMVYTVADEQDYHFKVLFEILKRLNQPYADGLHHLSYGMVDLPSGKMKSREGTVVDADDLMEEVIAEAKKNAEDRGGLEGISEEEKDEIYRKIGLGALKYFIIKVSPKKRMTFDPAESVDMQGQTGPYIQNAFVRIKSVLRKYDDNIGQKAKNYTDLNSFEMDLIKELVRYPEVIEESAKQIDPSLIANYCYDLAKTYHRFYHEVRILSAETEEAKSFRLMLSDTVASVLEGGMKLLGIEMPKRM